MGGVEEAMELLSSRPVKQTLHRLNISYRIIPLSQGWLYFCTPTQGPTFDLLDGADGSLTLWRFVGQAPPCWTKARLYYCPPNRPGLEVGLTATGDGDLCIYAQQSTVGKEHQVEDLIGGFLTLARNPFFTLCAQYGPKTMEGES